MISPVPSILAVAGADLLRRSSGDVEGRRGNKWEWGSLMGCRSIPGGAEMKKGTLEDGIVLK